MIPQIMSPIESFPHDSRITDLEISNAWANSWTRTIIITCLTYAAALGYLYLLGKNNPYYYGKCIINILK